jgi:deferrochelatase/peroxidase EfeB
MPATPTQSQIDPKDVQGLVRFGYKALSEACYMLLRIKDASAARAWCAVVPVATAEFLGHPPAMALQVAFTSGGLRALGLPADVLAGFSDEFLAGLAGDENRSARLGDVGPSAPDSWHWGSQATTPDVLVMLFAAPGKLDTLRATVQNDVWNAAFELILCLETSNMGGLEPFGFTDGVSQPAIDWEGIRKSGDDQIQFSNLVSAGEFLLGYLNEYGKYTDRPLVDSTDAKAAGLPPALDFPEKKDVGRNGTYVVMRTLEQDVRGFWTFLDRQTQSNPTARLQLAQRMVGRTTGGEPLVQKSSIPIEGIREGAPGDSNRFTFDQDPAGTQCPFGAHIRRANPRNGDFPGKPSWWLPRVWNMLGFASQGIRTDIMASTRFHRLLRRGREYGTALTAEQAVQAAPRDEAAQGLHFLCINANISRQFEFVQNAWLISAKFDGLAGESDPLTGNRSPVGDGLPTDTFTIPREQGVRQCIEGLPQFVTVRGGAYFFLPSISALQYFSRVGG